MKKLRLSKANMATQMVESKTDIGVQHEEPRSLIMSQLSMEGVLTMTIDEQLTELRPSKMRTMVQ